MEQLKELLQINPWIVIGSLITILMFWNFIQELLEKTIGKLIRKLGINLETKGMRQRREDHELLIKVSENLVKLQERHESDEKEFRNNLNNYMEESRKDRKALHDEMTQFTKNRVNDRQQSLQIQKELKDSIKGLIDGQKGRDEQIVALMCGSKELLGNTIDERYDKYIKLEGIPQNEVDEFDSIYEAYKGLNGNHGRQTKYEYVKKHLPVIPVKTTLIKYQ